MDFFAVICVAFVCSMELILIPTAAYCIYFLMIYIENNYSYKYNCSKKHSQGVFLELFLHNTMSMKQIIRLESSQHLLQSFCVHWSGV